MKALITGGAGFIGSALVRGLIADGETSVVNLDALTYASDPARLAKVETSPRYAFEHRDICDEVGLADVFLRHQPDVVVHLAAETHVDRSIDGPEVFMQANVVGASRLLSAATEYWSGLPGARAERFRFLHVSTDEVFGDLEEDAPAFTEASRYAPSSPYAASKAASDHLVSAWRRTYGLPTLIAHCSNSYGPGQFPEKLIPLATLNAAKGRPIPVYGAGEGLRDWLHVDDQVRALELVLNKGLIGRTYNIGGGEPRRAIEVVRAICASLEALAPIKPEGVRRYEDLITFVDDRPGHDRRYAMDTTRIERELGWKRRETFDAGLRQTVAWCLEHLERLERLQARCGGRRPGIPVARARLADGAER